MFLRCLLLLLAASATLPALGQIEAHEPYEPPDPEAGISGTNLFLNCPVTASPHWSDRVPELAVDGEHRNAGAHWAAENIPVSLTVDMGQERELNCIRLWTFWDDRRFYQYVIEGSLDGDAWTVLCDRRDNTTPSTAAGETFHFAATKARYIRTTFTHNSASNVAGGHIVEIEGYLVSEEEARTAAERTESWAKTSAGLHVAFGSVDVRYPHQRAPEGTAAEWSGSAWRGERVHAQAVAWTSEGLSQLRVLPTALSAEQATIPAESVSARFVRYVLADGKLVGDILDDAERLDVAPRTVRPVWVSVDVPAETPPGKYVGELRFSAAGGAAAALPITLEVLGQALPPPAEWSFHLDLWQNPYALARYHRVRPWSEEHLALLRPHLKLLASAGQKCITTTIVHRPWGTQTYDPYDSMVRWIRHADGTLSFDYSAFDTYVRLCDECGISKSINCYSMVSWTNAIRLYDEALGDYVTVSAAPGTDAYGDYWRPFLAGFVAHLRERGWLGRTAIAMDERPPELMQALLSLLGEAAPELKVALAGGNEPSLKDAVDDWCVFIAPPLDPAIASERRKAGRPTTFYVCCGPGRPNTFTFSPPAEAAWMGWYAAAQGYSGFLRWAHDSWVQDPLRDTSYVTWPAGDCFLTYPGPRSSIRFERLREGIQAYEKVRLLRERLGEDTLGELGEALAEFTYENVLKTPAAETIARANAALDRASRE